MIPNPNTQVEDVTLELAAVRGGRDKMIDLFLHERDRCAYLATKKIALPGGGIGFVQYICLATDEDAARAAMAELAGPGEIDLKVIPTAVMSRDCTVLDFVATK